MKKFKVGDQVFTYTDKRVMKRTVMKVIEETDEKFTLVKYSLSRKSGLGGGNYPEYQDDVFSSVDEMIEKIKYEKPWNETI